MKTKQINVKVSDEEKLKIESNSKKLGFYSISEYMRFICINAVVTIEVLNKE